MRNIALGGVAIVATALLGAQSANAGFAISLDDGVNPAFVVHDGDAADLAGLPGAIVLTNKVIGDWTVSVSTAFSQPLLGSLVTPNLDISSFTATKAGASVPATLKLTVTDTGFLPGGGLDIRTASTSIGGNNDASTGSSVTAKTYIDSGNAEFALTSLLNSIGPLTGASFSATDTDNFAAGVFPAGFYSMTLEVAVTHTSAGINTGFDAKAALGTEPSRDIPAPATLAVLGGGLMMLGWVRRTRQAA